MELRYEGPHDSVIVQIAADDDGERGYVEAERGDVYPFPDDEVHARIASGWVPVDESAPLPEEVVIGALTPEDCTPDPEVAAQLEAADPDPDSVPESEAADPDPAPVPAELAELDTAPDVVDDGDDDDETEV